MTAMEVDISAIVAAARDAARKETHRDGAVPAPKPAAPRRLSKTFKALRQKHQQHAAAHPRASRPSAVGARTPAEAAPLPKGPAVSKKSADPGPSPMEEIPTKKEEAAPIKKATAPVAAVPKETEEERHRRIERAKMEDALMRNEAVRRGKRVAESGKPWHVWSVEECEDVLLYFSAVRFFAPMAIGLVFWCASICASI